MSNNIEILFKDEGFSLDEFIHLENTCFKIEPYGENKFNELGLYWVARLEGTAVGYLYGNLHDNLHIHRLAVLEEHRRKGIGSKLIDAALLYLNSNCMLNVDITNRPAYELYIKKGFIPINYKYRYTFCYDCFNAFNGVSVEKGDGEEKFIVSFVKKNKVIGSGKFNRSISGCKDFEILNPKENVHSAITGLKSFVKMGNNISIMTNNIEIVKVLDEVKCEYKKALVEMSTKL